MLRSDLCDYSDAYIVIKGTIDILAAAANKNDKAQKNVAFKNNAPFRSCISKINGTLIDNIEDLDIMLLIYNQSESFYINRLLNNNWQNWNNNTAKKQ